MSAPAKSKETLIGRAYQVLRGESLSADHSRSRQGTNLSLAQLAALIPELENWMMLIAATTLFPGRQRAAAPPGLPPERIMELFELARDALAAARRAEVALMVTRHETWLRHQLDGLASEGAR
jgi:hypothetical protein